MKTLLKLQFDRMVGRREVDGRINGQINNMADVVKPTPAVPLCAFSIFNVVGMPSTKGIRSFLESDEFPDSPFNSQSIKMWNPF